MRWKYFNSIGLSLLLVILILFSSCVANVSTSASATRLASGSLITMSSISSSQAQPALPTITGVVAKVKQSVVIINDQVASTNIFNQPVQAAAAGSGWIIRTDGYIVTNAHVVQGATNIVITLNDGRTIPADKVYADAVTDLAIVKINAQNLPALSTGDSATLQVGDWVVAIGNALGQGTSATKGIVSALNISLSPAPGQLEHGLIQTDAAINPGNSGGPLVNMAGQVVGISSYKISQTGVEGMGYVISIDDALPVLNTLINTGLIVRPYLGADVFTIDATISAYYGLSVTQGVLITNVAAGSPAEKAGLQPGDVVTVVDGKNETDDAAMMDYINSLKVGQKIDITYYRGKNKNTVTITLVQAPSS
jgi:serine protease Do